MKRTAFGIKKAYWFVPIIFLTLSACSSAADMEEETPFQDTTKIIADAAAKIVNGTEENKEVILKDITWSEADNFMDGTVLNLHFSDGTSVSREISGQVESVEYIDFTGDGNKEAVVYSYFANTATEYTLINIFQINDGKVKELTPEMDIAEFAEELWSMSLIEVERDGIIYQGLELVSYNKMYALTYANKNMIIYYKNGRWELDQILYYDFDESWLEEWE